MGLAPTPWSAIDRYARRYNISCDMFELLVSGIRSLDAAMIDHEEEERERKEKADSNKAKRKKK